MFEIKFSTKNAAFEGDYAEEEIVRILKDVAGQVAALDGARGGVILDYNGNTVGDWSWLS